MANTVLSGFRTLSDGGLLNLRAVEVPEVKSAIDLSLAAHNALVNEYLSLWTDRTTKYTGRFRMNATGMLQPMDEFGRPKPMKYSNYSLGWPMKMAGGAVGWTWLAMEKMTVKEVNDHLSQLFLADVRWVRYQILNAFFDNTSGGVVYADPIYGNITTYGLANGEAGTLYYNQYTDSQGTDNHYYAQANAIDDAHNPFSPVHDELLEHPENGGEVVVAIPSNLVASVSALAEFVAVTPTPALQPGSAITTLASFASGVKLPRNARPLGYLKTSRVWVYELRYLPSNYWIAYVSQSPSPLMMREEPEASLQDFRPKGGALDEFPWYGDVWFRRCGFAGNNRVGAVVGFISSGSYSIPTGYGLQYT